MEKQGVFANTKITVKAYFGTKTFEIKNDPSSPLTGTVILEEWKSKKVSENSTMENM